MPGPPSTLENYVKFVALFSWDPADDQKAMEGLFKLWGELEKAIPPTPPWGSIIKGYPNFQAYSLIGARTILVIGEIQLKIIVVDNDNQGVINMLDLENFVAKTILGYRIESKVYFALDVHSAYFAVPDELKPQPTQPQPT